MADYRVPLKFGVSIAPWAAFAIGLDLTADENEELSGDPFDIEDGDIAMNAERDVRIVCNAYNSRVLWVDPSTGIVYDEPMSVWGDWAGECLWFLRMKDGEWALRDPFANQVIYTRESDPS